MAECIVIICIVAFGLNATSALIPVSTDSFLAYGGSTVTADYGDNELKASIGFNNSIVEHFLHCLNYLYNHFTSWLQSAKNNDVLKASAGYPQFVNSLKNLFLIFKNQHFETKDQFSMALNEAIGYLESALGPGYLLLGNLCARGLTDARAQSQSLLADLEGVVALAQTTHIVLVYKCSSSGEVSSMHRPSIHCIPTTVAGYNSSNPLNITVAIESSQFTTVVNNLNVLYISYVKYVKMVGSNIVRQGNTYYQQLVNNINGAFGAFQNQVYISKTQAAAGADQAVNNLLAVTQAGQQLASDLAEQHRDNGSTQTEALVKQVQNALQSFQSASDSLSS